MARGAVCVSGLVRARALGVLADRPAHGDRRGPRCEHRNGGPDGRRHGAGRGGQRAARHHRHLADRPEDRAVVAEPAARAGRSARRDGAELHRAHRGSTAARHRPGGFWSIGAGVAARLVRPESVIRASSFITAGISVATVVSLPLGSLIASVASWRVAFVIGAALGAVSLVGQLLLLPKIPSVQRVRASTLAALLKLPRARVGLIGAAFVFVAQFAAYTFVSPYLEELVELDAGTITVALLIFGVAGIVGNFAAGFTLSRSVTATVGVAMTVVAATIVLLPLLASSLVGVFVLLTAWGLVWGALPLGMQTWMANASPSASEGGLALFVTTIQLSIAAGSVVGGLAVTANGLAFDFWLAGGIAAVGAVVVFTLGLRGDRAVATANANAAAIAALEPQPVRCPA